VLSLEAATRTTPPTCAAPCRQVHNTMASTNLGKHSVREGGRDRSGIVPGTFHTRDNEYRKFSEHSRGSVYVLSSS